MVPLEKSALLGRLQTIPTRIGLVRLTVCFVENYEMRTNLHHRPVLKCPVDSLLGDLLIENNDTISIAFSNLACASLTPKMSLETKREDSGVDSEYLSISPCTIPSFRDRGYLELLRMRSICLVLYGEFTACRDWRRKSMQSKYKIIYCSHWFLSATCVLTPLFPRMIMSISRGRMQEHPRKIMFPEPISRKASRS